MKREQKIVLTIATLCFALTRAARSIILSEAGYASLLRSTPITHLCDGHTSIVPKSLTPTFWTNITFRRQCALNRHLTFLERQVGHTHASPRHAIVSGATPLPKMFITITGQSTLGVLLHARVITKVIFAYWRSRICRVFRDECEPAVVGV